jgi:U3 small nucleolar RNA-associated protein 7
VRNLGQAAHQCRNGKFHANPGCRPGYSKDFVDYFVTVKQSPMDSLISRANTALPKSIRPTELVPETTRKYNHIANKKLRTTLQRQSANTERGKALLQDAELLLPNSAGKMEMEEDMDRSWRISQDEIVNSIGIEAARGRKEFILDGGPYRARYTRNGRHMAVVGQKGHIATFDWQTGTMLSELQLQESCRDITYVLP